MCHRGSYMTRDGTFTVLGNGGCAWGTGAGGANGVRVGRVAGRAGTGRACTTAMRSGTESSKLFRDAPWHQQLGLLLPCGWQLLESSVLMWPRATPTTMPNTSPSVTRTPVTIATNALRVCRA